MIPSPGEASAEAASADAARPDAGATRWSAAQLARRRAAFLAALGGHAALVYGSPHALRNGDSEYRYRQGSDLYYLTGWEDPESAALFRPGTDQPFVLFVQPKDPEREVWTGRRAGVEGARERYGADVAWPIGELRQRLGDLCQGYGTLHYAYGEDAARDAAVFAALRAPARVAERNGLCVPHGLIDVRRTLGELRLRKSPDELGRLRRAAAITVEAHLAAMAKGRPGVTEYEVEAEVDYTFRRRGGNGPGYTTIVGGGVNATVLHYVVNDAPLRAGDLCLVDAGCEFQYYTADVTRTWPVDGRFSGPQRALYETVLAAHVAGIAAARPGAGFRDVHEAALRALVTGLVALDILDGEVDELIADEAYQPFFMHGTSHWLGLDVHDPGAYFTGLRSRTLEPGHVITVEPGLYFAPGDARVPEAFRGIGIRIEDDVLVTDDGPDVLTAACPTSIVDVEAACAR